MVLKIYTDSENVEINFGNEEIRKMNILLDNNHLHKVVSHGKK